MLGFLARRLLTMVPVLFLVSLMVFALVLVVPGDPAVTLAGDDATPAQVEAIRARLGLDDPVVVQYGRWVSHAVRGDLGTSLFTHQAVWDAILQNLPATFSLMLGGLVVTVVVGVPCGILAALNRGRWIDRVLSLAVVGGIAIPNYVLGMLLILVFVRWNAWFPATRYVAITGDPVEWLRHLVLPSMTLGLGGAAVITRQLRSSLVGVLQQDYILTARAKGMRSRLVVWKHAMKNAAIPVVTVLGTQAAFLLGGAALVETIFGIPGLGQLTINAVFSRDLPTIQGVVVVGAVTIMLVNLLVDLTYGYLNPRVRG